MTFGRRIPTRDITLDPANDSTVGITANLTHVYVLDQSERKAYAYDKLTGARPLVNIDIDASAGFLTNGVLGGWCNEQTIWLCGHTLAADAPIIRAYNLATRLKDTDKDSPKLDPDDIGTLLRGLWSDGTTIWVVPDVSVATFKIRAYRLSDWARMDTLDITIDTALGYFQTGLTSDGETFWFPQQNGLFGYSPARDSDKDIITGGLPSGPGFSDGIIWYHATGILDKVLAVAAVDAEAPPNIPTALAVTGVGENIDATWTAPVVVAPTTVPPTDGFGAAASYHARYRPVSAIPHPWITVRDIPLTETRLSGLNFATTYEVQVLAVNEGGESPWTASATAFTGPPPFFHPAARIQYRIRAFMYGAWVDLTNRLETMEWTLGGPQVNAFGTIYPSARASFLFRNRDGALTSYAPAINVDTSAGPPVEIATRTLNFPNWVTQFTGFSDGFSDFASPVGGLSTMLALGSLAYIEEWTDDVFIRASGTLRTDEVIVASLDDIGWPANLRHIAQGDVSVFAHEVVKAGVFSQGRSRASFTSTAKIAALLENGRGFDGRDGFISYENYNLRPTAAAAFGPNTISIDPDLAYISDGTAAGFAGSQGIINIIESDSQAYISRGSNVPVVMQGGLPQSLVIPAGASGYGMRLRSEEAQLGRVGQSFVQSWTAPIRGIGYTYSLAESAGGAVQIDTGENFIRLLCENPSAAPHTLTVTALSGNVFQRTLGAAISQRRNESIVRFRPRPVQIPGDAVADLVGYRAMISQLLDIHDGLKPVVISGNTVFELDPIRRINARMRLDQNANTDTILQHADISRKVSVRAPHLGIATAQDFFLDGAQHVVDERKTHVVTLNLFEARAFEMKP